MCTFYEIKEKLKKTMGVPSDRFMSEDLGIKYENFRNRVLRNAIPFREVIEFCKDKELNPMEILYTEAKNGK